MKLAAILLTVFLSTRVIHAEDQVAEIDPALVDPPQEPVEEEAQVDPVVEPVAEEGVQEEEAAPPPEGENQDGELEDRAGVEDDGVAADEEPVKDGKTGLTAEEVIARLGKLAELPAKLRDAIKKRRAEKRLAAGDGGVLDNVGLNNGGHRVASPAAVIVFN